MPKFRHFPLLVALLIGACTKAPEHATTLLARAEPVRESRALCLAEVRGDKPVDIALRRAQAGTRHLPGRADPWIAAGRGWVREARLNSDPGFYLNVDGCASEALAATPDFIPALELHSLVLMNDHRFEQARALSEKILAQAPDNAVADGILSDALLEMGRYPEAAQAVQAQMSAHPGMAANARASHLNWLRGDTRSAKLFIRDALMDRNADDPEAAAWTFVEAGMIYWHEGDYAGADAIFSEALRWLPDYPPALVGRGRVALAEGRGKDAIAALTKAQHLHPLVETAWLLGDAYTLAGDDAQARLSYADAERQGRRGDKLTLGFFLADKGRNPGEALRLIEEERRNRGGAACAAGVSNAATAACGGIYVDDAYAWALYRAGRLDDARRVSAQATRMGTRDARLLYHAGAIDLAAGETARGRKRIAQALALNPGFDLTGAAEARGLLDARARAATALARN
jgi:tetratricopeptide (TPR) repeat protein